MANKKKFLSKEQIVAAQGVTKSNMAAARYLHVSYQHYKKYAKMYNLFEDHKNQAGKGIPKFLRTFFSPVGVLLIGGLVHDYAYKYKTLLKANKKDTMGELTQKRADEIFRDINIIVNGFYTMNRLAYWSLRIGGFVAWNGHRKRNSKIPGVK